MTEPWQSINLWVLAIFGVLYVRTFSLSSRISRSVVLQTNLSLGLDHRRRKKTEEKAEKATVVPAVWGTEFIEFFVPLAILQ